tara:strand:- start:535 stop:1089 length:555 start_codon:yes stop_codon:yes gene_type:complete
MTVWRNKTFGTAHAFGFHADVGRGTVSGMCNEDILVETEYSVVRNLNVKKLCEDAVIPTKSHEGDLGYDLYTSEPVTIEPNETVLISTGVAIQFPTGYGGLIKDRSSVATKQKLFTVAGVIDNGYVGEIKIAMNNASGKTQSFEAGTKIAQLVLIPVTNFIVTEVDELTTSDGRGQDGFGSTGE